MPSEPPPPQTPLHQQSNSLENSKLESSDVDVLVNYMNYKQKINAKQLLTAKDSMHCQSNTVLKMTPVGWHCIFTIFLNCQNPYKTL